MRRRTTRSASKKTKVALCATCLVDAFYPEVGQAVVNVLRRQGMEVSFPQDQTCCGQPAYNGGFRRDAVIMARRLIALFQGVEYVVVPSGSCAAMIKIHYPRLFRDDAVMLPKAEDLAARTYEFSDFMVNVLKVDDTASTFTAKLTYHESCHLLRDLHVSSEPRTLIRSVRGSELVEMERCGECCGFGGLFSVNYPYISTAILNEKLEAIDATGAEVLVSSDMGCLMHIKGAMSHRSMEVKAMHLAELLDHQESRAN